MRKNTIQIGWNKSDSILLRHGLIRNQIRYFQTRFKISWIWSGKLFISSLDYFSVFWVYLYIHGEKRVLIYLNVRSVSILLLLIIRSVSILLLLISNLLRENVKNLKKNKNPAVCSIFNSLIICDCNNLPYWISHYFILLKYIHVFCLNGLYCNLTFFIYASKHPLFWTRVNIRIKNSNFNSK